MIAANSVHYAALAAGSGSLFASSSISAAGAVLTRRSTALSAVATAAKTAPTRNAAW
jgi:hypothetical protein